MTDVRWQQGEAVSAQVREITLTGQVLPIGGLKEKSLAAQQAEMKLVIAPADNAADVEEIPKPLLKNIKFEFVDSIDQVIKLALSPNGKASNKKTKSGKTSAKTSTKR